MVNLVEINQLCRLCLVKDQVNVPIFEDDVQQIFLKISACLPVKVTPEDRLPKKICSDCSYKLDLFYQFWNTSSNSEKQLLAWLNEMGLNQDTVTDGRAVQKPQTDLILKQEAVELEPEAQGDASNNSVLHDTPDYVLQQQLPPFQTPSFTFSSEGDFPASEVSETTAANTTLNDTKETPLKRKRVATTPVAQTGSDEDDDDDDVGTDTAETKVTKTEETSDDDHDDHEDDAMMEEDQDSAFVSGVPATSTDNEQPGPSGMGKTISETPSAPDNGTDLDNNDFSRQQSESSPVFYKCGLCEIIVKKKAQIIRHLKNHNPKILMCYGCPKGFEREKERKRHYRQIHMEKKIACEKCGALFRDNSLLKSHLRSHNNARPFKCWSCEKSFKTSIALKYHIQVRHTFEYFFCSECHARQPKSFAKQKICDKCVNLPPKPEMNYVCNVCNKVYKDKYYLQYHQRKHNPDYESPTYNCEKCSGKFKTRSYFKRHLPCNLGNNRYMCEACGKHLTTRASLRDHMVLHTGEKPYICEVCGKAFSKRTSLKVHTVVHTKEKPHSCYLCDKKFTQRNGLKFHIRSIHTGEKPYECDKCDKKFVSRTALNSHLKFHEIPIYD